MPQVDSFNQEHKEKLSLNIKAKKMVNVFWDENEEC